MDTDFSQRRQELVAKFQAYVSHFRSSPYNPLRHIGNEVLTSMTPREIDDTLRMHDPELLRVQQDYQIAEGLLLQDMRKAGIQWHGVPPYMVSEMNL